MKQLFFAFTLLFFVSVAEAQHGIIPTPVSYTPGEDAFHLQSQLNLDLQTDDVQTVTYASQFAEILSQAGITVKRQQATSNVLSIFLNKTKDVELGTEGYMLNVSKTQIMLSANAAAGIFNGLQTLRQMFPAGFEVSTTYQNASVRIPGCQIKDYPQFSWRGLMFDVSRHFFSVADVKDFIDRMAKYKFNVFHWHLTDDEGWRIEIKSLPKLTTIGAWRVARYGRFGETRPNPKPEEKATYGGFYTQEEIKDVVQYAAARNITIVPEIDVPGHSMALLAAYPELSTKKEPKFVNPGIKFSEWFDDGSFKMLIENTLNPADEKVYTLLDNVFTEVAALFPGQYIHMGGDECYHGFWEESPEVKAFMKKKKIADAHELQNYFAHRMEKIIASKGKKMIGWDEILNEKLTKNAAIMSWRGEAAGIKASNEGYNVVMSPTTFAYLDYTQGDHSVENPIYADLSLEKTYSFTPAPKGSNLENILGGQGNLWTEVIPNLQFAYYMTYPRAFALAESLWSPKLRKNWDDFVGRTEKHIARFAAENTNISTAMYEPTVKVYQEGETLMCSLSNSIPTTEIYYSVDNTYPVKFAQKYTKPFAIPEGNLGLRTQTYRKGKALGREIRLPRETLEKRAK